MSNWTHVAAIFRCDVLIDWNTNPDETFDESIERIFGKQFPSYPLDLEDYDAWEQYSAAMTDAENNPGDYIPFGSEGGLTISVWENPDPHYLARYTISIFGDLRDHDDVELIHTWFTESCSKVGWLRQAVCTAHNEYYGTKSWTSCGCDDEEENEEGDE